MSRIPAVSYLRVSGQAQIDGDGFTRQREAIARRATALGAQVLEEFKDEAVSGTKPLSERPGLSGLLERVLGNGIRLVLVEKADRLARDLVEGELILREFRQAGVTVVETEGGTDLTDGDDSNPTARLIRQVLGAVSEFEKGALVQKLRAARARKRRETGRCEGPRPYGELPGEAQVLERMKALSRTPRGRRGRSLQAICEILNEEGHRTRHGLPWRPKNLSSLRRRRAG